MFSRSRKSKTPAAAGASSALTFGELETAIGAALEQLCGEAADTLGNLSVVFDGPPDAALKELAPGPQLVTTEEVDRAIEEAGDVLGPRAVTISVLKEARAFLARAEQAPVPAVPASEKLLGLALYAVDRAAQRSAYADGDVASCLKQTAAAFRLSPGEIASIERVLAVFDEARTRVDQAERKRASERAPSRGLHF